MGNAERPAKNLFKGIRTLSLLCLFFSWIFIVPNRWNAGVALSIISILTFLLGRRGALELKRAYLYHLYVFLAIFPFTVLCVAASLWLFESAEVNVPHFHLSISSLVILSFGAAFWLFQSMFLKSREANIKSGRLDLNAHRWDLGAPLQHSNTQRNSFQPPVGCLSPLVIALAFYLARNLHGDSEIYLRASGVFFFGFLLMIGYAAYQLAVSAALLKWERQSGGPIELSHG